MEEPYRGDELTFKQFKPTHYLDTDEGDRLLVMIAYSSKHGEKVVSSVRVESGTNRVIGNIVESRLRTGYHNSVCFNRNKQRYYLAWLKPLSKIVDKK